MSPVAGGSAIGEAVAQVHGALRTGRRRFEERDVRGHRAVEHLLPDAEHDRVHPEVEAVEELLRQRRLTARNHKNGCLGARPAIISKYWCSDWARQDASPVTTPEEAELADRMRCPHAARTTLPVAPHLMCRSVTVENATDPAVQGSRRRHSGTRVR